MTEHERDGVGSIRKARFGASSGIALLEVVIGAVVMTIAIGAMGMVLARTSSLAQANRESELALQAAQTVLADVRAEVFEEAFARYNATVADDLAGVNPGDTFAVVGLNVRANDADGMVGQILFPGNGVTLSETVADDLLGTPRDLDGDEVLEAVIADYQVLPVVVRVEWTGASGDRQIQLVSTLSNRGGP